MEQCVSRDLNSEFTLQEVCYNRIKNILNKNFTKKTSNKPCAPLEK